MLFRSQRINLNCDRDVKLFFRVGQVYKNAKIFVESNDEVILSRRRPKLAPGEMEDVVIKNEVLKELPVNSELVIRVEV